MEMKIFLTGATGFIGSNLINKLLKLNVHLTCYIRNKNNKKELENKGCKVIIGEILDYDKLVDSLKNMDVVIHLVGIGNVSENSEEAYQNYKKINVEGTETLARASIKARVKKFIYLSSIAAMGSKCEGVMDENSKPNPTIPYEHSKLESELVLQNLSKKSEMQFFILRPTWVIGKGDRGKDILKLARMIKKGFVPLVNGGKFYTMLVSVDSVADAIICCFKKNIRGFRIYIISDEKSYQQKELINMISDSMIEQKLISKKPLIIYVPKSLLFSAGLLMEIMTKITNSTPFISRKRVHSMSQNRHYSISKAKNELRFIPTPVKKAVDEEIKWLNHGGII